MDVIIILIAIIAFIAVLANVKHQEDVKNDPIENWEPPEELHINITHHEENKTPK
jgi:hypothetical protein